MKKREVIQHKQGSILYVLAHSIFQKSRGKKPSATYKGIRNPRKALEEASMDADMVLLMTEPVE